DADHNVTYEDQESFQDQEKFHFHWKCNEDLLMLYGEYCLNITFHTGMMELGESNWCDWDMACFFPDALLQQAVKEEEAPESVVIILTLLPVCIIPIAVYMAVASELCDHS
uniref:Uncharacterized protein n=1 Tax=Astyanax mexicanus TaxID=7994 RepID=A0A3B1JTZ0_ASTMX